MKIGILTYHRCHNYGAILQALGLRQYLTNQGHEVYFIDYWPKYHKKEYYAFRQYDLSKTKLKSIVKGVVEDTFLFPLKIQRIRKFNRFIDSFITPYCSSEKEDFDCIICGSDQIWRKQPGLNGNFDPVFFGAGKYHAKNYISYAGSMGEINLSKEDESILKSLLGNFKEISVREDVLANLLKNIGVDRDIKMVADPTILFGSSQWFSFLNKQPRKIKENYVLYYKLADFAFKEDVIRQYAKDRRLPLIILEGRVRNDDYFNGSITDADPMEMLNLIANASYVFTSSYHGLIFSLLFNRQVCCSFTKNRARAKSLLDYLDIPNRMINEETVIPDGDIDYSKVNPLMESLSENSKKWLNQTLNNC